MALLLTSDYEFLSEVDQIWSEDESRRFLILRDFRLPLNVYNSGAIPAESANFIFQIPPNYNHSGPDMFWVNPPLELARGGPIPQAQDGNEPIEFEGLVYERWSRHWYHIEWHGRKDGVGTIIDRLTWALSNPDPQVRNG